MKMLLLDVENKEIKMVEANGLDDYYELIGCRCIDIVRRTIGDVEVEIVLDDEGALVNQPKISAISPEGTPMLYGNLLVASGRVTDDGELTELDEDEIEAILTWNVATITTSVYKEPYPVFVEMNY